MREEMAKAKPRLFVSKCLGQAACRWNGVMISQKFIADLTGKVDLVTECPEVAIGLGIPRDPIRIVEEQRIRKLVQLNTGKDCTDEMTAFASSFLDGMGTVDGFILKGRSPSCGLYDVKVYPGTGPGSPLRKGAGFFGEEVLRRFEGLAIETDGRLHDPVLREHFLTKLFTLARFRVMAGKRSKGALSEFQAANKLLFLAYSEQHMREMGRIAAATESRPIEEALHDYREHLYKAFRFPARRGANINVLMHAMGFFSERLKADEKRYFLNTLEEYRRGQISLSVPVRLAYANIVRFGEPYLEAQSFFELYPKDLIPADPG